MQVFIEQYDPSIEDEFRRSDVVGYKKINTREQLSTYLKRYLPEVEDEFVSTVCNSPRNVVVQVPGNFKHVCPSTGMIYKISLKGSYLPDGAEEELTGADLMCAKRVAMYYAATDDDILTRNISKLARENESIQRRLDELKRDEDILTEREIARLRNAEMTIRENSLVMSACKKAITSWE